MNEQPDPTSKPERDPHEVHVLCENCGDIIVIKDVQSFLLALHIQNACPVTSGLLAGGE